MRHLTLAGLAVTAAGTAAMAGSGSPLLDTANVRDIDYSVSRTPVGEPIEAPQDNFKVSYSSMNGFAAGAVVVGAGTGGFIGDDYTKAQPFNTAAALNSIRFVGGNRSVANGGTGQGIIDFFFLDENFVTVDAFAIDLTATTADGLFIWTFSLKAADPPVIKPDNGFLFAVPRTGELVWFLDSGATPGTITGSNVPGNNDNATGSSVDTVYAFELRNVPTPGALAVFGLAGLAGVRRRRA